MMVGDAQGAVAVIEDVMAATPGFGFGYNILWQAYHLSGQKDKAIEAAKDYFRIARGDPTGAEALEEVYPDGDYEDAWLHAADVLAEHSKSVHVPALSIAALYEYGGNTEKAIDWFEVSYKRHDPDAPYLAVLTFDLKSRSHPRFIKLMREMGHDYWADKYSKL